MQPRGSKKQEKLWASKQNLKIYDCRHHVRSMPDQKFRTLIKKRILFSKDVFKELLVNKTGV